MEGKGEGLPEKISCRVLMPAGIYGMISILK